LEKKRKDCPRGRVKHENDGLKALAYYMMYDVFLKKNTVITNMLLSGWLADLCAAVLTHLGPMWSSPRWFFCCHIFHCVEKQRQVKVSTW
jgi:hypothetical protein